LVEQKPTSVAGAHLKSINGIEREKKNSSRLKFIVAGLVAVIAATCWYLVDQGSSPSSVSGDAAAPKALPVEATSVTEKVPPGEVPDSPPNEAPDPANKAVQPETVFADRETSFPSKEPAVQGKQDGGTETPASASVNASQGPAASRPSQPTQGRLDSGTSSRNGRTIVSTALEEALAPHVALVLRKASGYLVLTPQGMDSRDGRVDMDAVIRSIDGVGFVLRNFKDVSVEVVPGRNESVAFGSPARTLRNRLIDSGLGRSRVRVSESQPDNAGADSEWGTRLWIVPN
jgi:hypothetical protein